VRSGSIKFIKIASILLLPVFFLPIFLVIPSSDMYQALEIPGLNTFSCVRSKSPRFECELISTGLFRTYKTKIQSEQIQSAEVYIKKERDREGGSQEISQVFLKTDRGKVFLFNANEKLEIINPLFIKINNRIDADKINSFIGNSQEKSLIVAKDTRLNWIFSMIFDGFGFVIILPMIVYFSFK
jgi:hypothetical protein